MHPVLKRTALEKHKYCVSLFRRQRITCSMKYKDPHHTLLQQELQQEKEEAVLTRDLTTFLFLNLQEKTQDHSE